MRGLPVVAVTAALLAGCLGASPAVDPASTNASAEIVLDEDRPDATFTDDVKVGPSAPPDAEATLDAPPQLRVGEWWKVKFRSSLSGIEQEYVRVVGAHQGDTYVLGMPHEGWYKEAVLYHTPALGDVNLDLTYYTHDELFTPIKFPVQDGETWTTTFSGQPLTGTAKRVDDRTAELTFRNANGAVALEAVYDATLHEMSSFDHFTATYRIIDHGYGYEGWVTVPRGEDLVLLHGRAAGAVRLGQPPVPPEAAPPAETVTIDGGFNRISFGHLLGGLPNTPLMQASPGYFRVTSTAPNGTQFLTEVLPGQPFRVENFEYADPDGEWNFEFVAAGGGFAFVEGIAYHQYDIRLPDGLKRTDHSHPVIR